MSNSKQVNPDQDIQYNFAYLIDTSDSVGNNTLRQAKDAYTNLTESLIETGIADVSQFAIIPFGSDASLQTPANATEVISTIEGLSGNGFTNFDAALNTAYEFFSSQPSGTKNIAYFLSDGYSTIGGSFEDSAKSLQEVADVQAYGFGLANIQELRIIDSDQPDIVPEASELASKFSASVGGLISSNPESVDSNTDRDNDIEIASAPPSETNQAVEDNSSDSTGQEIEKKDEEKLVDDSGVGSPLELSEPETPSTSPELEISDVAGLGADLETSTDRELPVVDIEDISIEEGDSGSSTAQFTVNLSSPATEEVQFSYETIDVTAASGSDYNQTSGQITIPIGETSAEIDVEINGDTEVEPNEEFTIKLSELSSATFANQQTEYSKAVVIENDDVIENSTIVPTDETPITQIPDNESLFDGNILDLESFNGEVTIDFAVDGNASYRNSAGLYKIDDAQGTITDPITGNQFTPSDGEAYTQLAIQLQEPNLELSLDAQNTITTLEGGSNYGLLFFTNLDGDSPEGNEVYFSFSEANSDKIEHIRSLGNNTLGLEDLFSGGDNDFNDMVIRADIAQI
ncbi:MAG: VWA domain-containing protein [Cyanobacteria bacterium J06643_5]